jgi:hypothetical protein
LGYYLVFMSQSTTAPSMQRVLVQSIQLARAQQARTAEFIARHPRNPAADQARQEAFAIFAERVTTLSKEGDLRVNAPASRLVVPLATLLRHEDLTIVVESADGSSHLEMSVVAMHGDPNQVRFFGSDRPIGGSIGMSMDTGSPEAAATWFAERLGRYVVLTALEIPTLTPSEEDALISAQDRGL